MSTEKNDLTEENTDEIARLADGYSGADMKNLCQEASLGPIRSIDFRLIGSIESQEVKANEAENELVRRFSRLKDIFSLFRYVRWRYPIFTPLWRWSDPAYRRQIWISIWNGTRHTAPEETECQFKKKKKKQKTSNFLRFCIFLIFFFGVCRYSFLEFSRGIRYLQCTRVKLIYKILLWYMPNYMV